MYRRTSNTIRIALYGVAFLLSSVAWAATPAPRFTVVSTVGFGDELTCFGMSHRDPNFVMVGTNHGKLHRSTDGGATWQEITVTPFRDLFFGRERHDDPRLEYALGLPGKSPMLQRWLRNRGLRTSGINLQQLLVQKGDKSVAINWIEVDWHNENRVYLGTTDGIYRSLDKGRSFLRIWQGRTSMSERVINTIATDPFDPKTLIVGTASGLFTSHDRGTTFRKEMNFYVRDSYIRALYFDPEMKGLMHMAMGGAAMATPDAGKHWITTYWDLWGPRSDVQWIGMGPQNVRVLATRDGIFASLQGGEYGTWKRHGKRFVGENVTRALVANDPTVWYALTDLAVWRSTDIGQTWVKIMQLGGREFAKWIHAFQGDEKQMWLLTNRRVYRVGEPPAFQRAGPPRRASRRQLNLPPLAVVWRKVMDYKHVHFGDNQAYRNRAPYAAMLPTLIAGAFLRFGRDVRLIKMVPHVHWPYVYFNSSDENSLGLEFMASWDFSRLVFDRRELPSFGRIQRNLENFRQDLSERTFRLYAEYRDTANLLVTRPPKDLLVREFQRIRLQEIAAFLDVISGGYWSKATGGIP